MKQFLLLLVLAFCLAACDKDNSEPVICSDTAYVEWGADPAADGLGWYIADSVGGLKIYIPQNLPDDYKLNRLSIKVCLVKTDEKFFCQCATPLNKYFISSIRKR